MIAETISGVALLTVIAVPIALSNWDRFKSALRDLTRPLP